MTAKQGGRALKVFAAQIGFYDTVVAVPSKAAALRAWDTHQDLFAGGEARLADDAQAMAAARAHPGVPLRRVIGTANPYELDPRGLPEVPPAPKRSATPAARKPPPRPRAADRAALDAAEAAARAVDNDRRHEEAALDQRRSELDADAAAAQSRYATRREAAAAAVTKARDAYRKAGGGD